MLLFSSYISVVFAATAGAMSGTSSRGQIGEEKAFAPLCLCLVVWLVHKNEKVGVAF